MSLNGSASNQTNLHRQINIESVKAFASMSRNKHSFPFLYFPMFNYLHPLIYCESVLFQVCFAANASVVPLLQKPIRLLFIVVAHLKLTYINLGSLSFSFYLSKLQMKYASSSGYFYSSERLFKSALNVNRTNGEVSRTILDVPPGVYDCPSVRPVVGPLD